MRIDSSGIIASLIQGSKGKKPDEESAVRQSESSSARQPDKVTLTNTASRLQHAEIALGSHPMVNTLRVEQVQHTVNEGKLETSAFQLADKMLNFEQALNRARKGV